MFHNFSSEKGTSTEQLSVCKKDLDRTNLIVGERKRPLFHSCRSYCVSW